MRVTTQGSGPQSLSIDPAFLASFEHAHACIGRAIFIGRRAHAFGIPCRAHARRHRHEIRAGWPGVALLQPEAGVDAVHLAGQFAGDCLAARMADEAGRRLAHRTRYARPVRTGSGCSNGRRSRRRTTRAICLPGRRIQMWAFALKIQLRGESRSGGRSTCLRSGISRCDATDFFARCITFIAGRREANPLDGPPPLPGRHAQISKVPRFRCRRTGHASLQRSRGIRLDECKRPSQHQRARCGRSLTQASRPRVRPRDNKTLAGRCFLSIEVNACLPISSNDVLGLCTAAPLRHRANTMPGHRGSCLFRPANRAAAIPVTRRRSSS